MTSNWTIWEIAEQVQLAARMSREVEEALAAPNARREIAVLLADVTQIASAHERLLARLRDELSPFNSSFEIADKLAAHWQLLSSALEAKISELGDVGFAEQAQIPRELHAR